MNILQKNLDLLESLDPYLFGKLPDDEPPSNYELFLARTGMPTLKVDGVLFHSSYDPEKEALKWAESVAESWNGFSTILIYGSGLGYHILALSDIVDANLVIVEPDINVFRLFLERTDIVHLIDRTAFLLAPEPEEMRLILKNNILLAPHLPTVRINDYLYYKIERRLKLSERFRILVVGPVYGGSLPVAGYCADALERLGYEVSYVNLGRFSEIFKDIGFFTSDKSNIDKLRGMLTLFFSELIMARVVEFKPDLVFALAQAPVTEDLLQRLRGYAIPTALWFVEDYHVMDYWRNIAPFYDYFFTIQKQGFLNELAVLGVSNVSYLPLAASPGIHRPLSLSDNEAEEFGSELSFVGAGYYNRRRFFLNLIDLDFKIWGNEWSGAIPLNPHIQHHGERISTEECVKIFNASKINLNLHSSTHHEGVNPYGDFVNPRTFEIAASGAFQLVDYRSELAECFDVGREIICFNDIADAREKISYYISHPEKAVDVAKRARARVLKDHTYLQRMESMIGYLLDKGFRGAKAIPGRYMVNGLIREAGSDTGLGQYLSRFLDRRSIGLQDVVEDIGKSSGNLTDTEAIFIAMNEFMHRTG